VRVVHFSLFAVAGGGLKRTQSVWRDFFASSAYKLSKLDSNRAYAAAYKHEKHGAGSNLGGVRRYESYERHQEVGGGRRYESYQSTTQEYTGGGGYGYGYGTCSPLSYGA